MVALKTADIDKFLARPDPARPVVLVYGPDAGLVSGRVNALIKASVDDVADPFSLVRLEAEDLSANPARLVEARRAELRVPGVHVFLQLPGRDDKREIVVHAQIRIVRVIPVGAERVWQAFPVPDLERSSHFTVLVRPVAAARLAFRRLALQRPQPSPSAQGALAVRVFVQIGRQQR